MNILIFSGGIWDDTKENGNTFSNFFHGDIWSKDNFFNIYLRKSRPNNPVCKNYFQMPATDMIKYFFNPNKIGIKLKIDENEKYQVKKEKLKEQKYIDIIHKYSLSLIYILMNYIYRRKKWLNNSFKAYIKESNPDVFFAFATNTPILKLMIEYIKNNTKARIVLFISDDFYGEYDKKIFFERKKLKEEYKSIIKEADQLYGITEEICEEYSKIFNKKIDLLHKGCSFEYCIKNKTNNPIKFIYAGNLLYGRDETLNNIAKAIEKSNSINKQKAILEIYTGTTITRKLEKKLNIPGSSIIMGKREYDEIKKISNESDYVIHVESFSKKQIDYVKYSFSTKIIDCMQSGSCFVAIGPKQIASMKFVEKIQGAHIITEKEKIEESIIDLINNKNILEDSKKIREFALENYEIAKIQKKLKYDMLSL